VHRMDDAEVVDVSSHMRKQLADPLSGLAASSEFVRGF